MAYISIYRNQLNNLQAKLIDWFLYDGNSGFMKLIA